MLLRDAQRSREDAMRSVVRAAEDKADDIKILAYTNTDVWKAAEDVAVAAASEARAQMAPTEDGGQEVKTEK